MKYTDNKSRELQYRMTFGISLIVSQLIFIFLFLFWPKFEYQDSVFEKSDGRDIQLDMIEFTRQSRNIPPSPPNPNVPVDEPVDHIMYDEPDLEVITSLSKLAYDNLPESEGDRIIIFENPQVPPNVIRIVEPVMPPEARQANISAQIKVTFLVNPDGDVEEVSISEILLLDDNNNYQTVESIGYGLIEATLNAANKWQFRAAEHDGKKVSALTRHYFTYGI
ncbi:MAG: energy transducer TonB [Balneolales bacterium]